MLKIYTIGFLKWGFIPEKWPAAAKIIFSLTHVCIYARMLAPALAGIIILAIYSIEYKEK